MNVARDFCIAGGNGWFSALFFNRLCHSVFVVSVVFMTVSFLWLRGQSSLSLFSSSLVSIVPSPSYGHAWILLLIYCPCPCTATYNPSLTQANCRSGSYLYICCTDHLCWLVVYQQDTTNCHWRRGNFTGEMSSKDQNEDKPVGHSLNVQLLCEGPVRGG